MSTNIHDAMFWIKSKKSVIIKLLVPCYLLILHSSFCKIMLRMQLVLVALAFVAIAIVSDGFRLQNVVTNSRRTSRASTSLQMTNDHVKPSKASWFKAAIASMGEFFIL